MSRSMQVFDCIAYGQMELSYIKWSIEWTGTALRLSMDKGNILWEDAIEDFNRQTWYYTIKKLKNHLKSNEIEGANQIEELKQIYVPI